MGSWREERDSFIRAFAGAFVFGVPLLFTMEMWWIGEYIDGQHLLTFLTVALIANIGLNYAAGFKRESTLGSAVEESIDAVAVGIVGATVMLLVLNQINPDQSADTILGRVAIQAVPLSIGASVSNQVFGQGNGGRSRQGNGNGESLSRWQAVFSDVGATAIGGVFIGASVAPTEEIPMIAAALDYSHLLALVAFSLLLSYGIVFVSGFDRSTAEGPFQHPFTETMLAYVVSLTVAFVALYLFERITFSDPLLSIVEQVLVLGVPATVGGAAGRLVV